MTTELFPCHAPAEGADRLHTLRNAHGMVLTISERGAALVSWWAPDRYGRVADVLHTDVNGRGQHPHGGPDGFHCARWHAEAEQGGLSLRLASPDGEGGFPGNLEVQVRYRLTGDGSLTIDYQAVTDAPTPVKLTVHPYFNLNGGSAGVGDHMLQIDADGYLEIDAAGIPVNLVSVGGTAFDFRQPAAIGPRLQWPDPQLRLAGGFDHCYDIKPAGKGRSGALREVARVYDPGSGRRLQVATTEVGLQFYTGNALDGVHGRGAHPYCRHDGFGLAAHAFPGQVNGPHPAAVILLPGQVYRQTTVYRLGLQPSLCCA